MLEPGNRLGPYKIIARIGSGGMGEVYRALDVRLEREVAVKILTERLSRDPDSLVLFQREAKAVAALSHPNIMAIHDFDHDDTTYYTVTELLEGENLRERLGRAPLPWRKATEICLGIAEGLAAAHAKGIVHRDLKPENVFLTANGQVKILDFGLAAFKPKPRFMDPQAVETESLPTEEQIFGTAGYMAPEQASNGRVDGRSDIFSLGCILYESLTGNKAFFRETVYQTIAAVLEEEPVPVSESGRKIPLDLQKIVDHCLEKNPGERFQSAQDLAFQLKAILSSDSMQLQPPAPRQPGKTFWIASGLAVVLVIVLGFLLAGRGRPVRSIAVLPFTNLTRDADIEYVSDGMAETIIDRLSELNQLKVMARSTVFRYKERNVDPVEVGKKLNVEAVLLGSIEKQNDSLTVKVELVKVKDGSQLWGTMYTHAASKLLPVQAEISRQIVAKLQLEITGEQERRVSKRHTQNDEAFQLYLKGRYSWNKRTPDDMKQAVNFFREAIDMDPSYALAYSGLADAYSTLGNYKVMPMADAYEASRGAATRALEIDEELAEPHASLGLVYTYYWQWGAAENEFKRAIQMKPGYSTAHQWYANLLEYTGRPDDAIAQIEKAEELDPLSLIINSAHGLHLLIARRFDEAEAQLKKTLTLDPNFAYAHQTLGEVYVQKRMYPKAIDEFLAAIRLTANPDVTAELIHVYAVSGDTEKALRTLQELLANASRQPAPFELAVVYTGLNKKDDAFRYLEQCYNEHSPSALFIRLDPRLQDLRGDPRYRTLLSKMGLKP